MAARLGFGCMRLPLAERDGRRTVDMAELRRMVDAFLDSGFDCFDVAPTYCEGLCEDAVRRALTERHPRSRYRLCDKLPVMQIADAAHQERTFGEQLIRCGVERFDRYLVHCATEGFWLRAEALGSFDFVLRKRDEGLVGEAGFSFHGSPELLDRILTQYASMDLVQLQINYLDWELTSVCARRCYETARRHGKRVVAMCTQKGGLLAAVPPSAERILRRADSTLSPSEWALRFAASPDGVDTVLSGMSSLREVRRNCKTMQRVQPMDGYELEVLAQAAAEIAAAAPVQCTGCGYCVAGCPSKIPIPECLSYCNSTSGSGLRTRPVAAAECSGCGNCERICPQRLPIIESLRRVAAEVRRGGAAV